MRQFVPMTDDLLYQPDKFPGPLVPYQCGVPCWHQLMDAGAAHDASPAPFAVTSVGAESLSESPSARRRA